MAAEWVPRSEYGRKLQDPRWQKKRLEILERDRFQCQVCGDCRSMLHVHHVAYDPVERIDPWEYIDETLVTLCARCHDAEEMAERRAIYAARRMLAIAGLRTFIEIEFVAEGLDQRLFRENRNTAAWHLADLIERFASIRDAGMLEGIWFTDE